MSWELQHDSVELIITECLGFPPSIEAQYAALHTVASIMGEFQPNLFKYTKSSPVVWPKRTNLRVSWACL